MARRRAKRGDGTVYQRKDRPGTYVAEITIAGRTVREHRKSRAEATAALEEMKSRAGVSDAGTLGAWLRRWSDSLDAPPVKGQRRRRRQQKTIDTYRGIVKNQWLRSEIAKLPVNEVEASDVEDALAEMMDEGLSRQTAIHARAVLSVAYTEARRERPRVADYNPCLDAEVPGEAVAPRVRTLRLSTAFARRISAAFVQSPDRPLMETILHTGCRPQEALALRWPDVDLGDEAMIHLRDAVKQAGGRWYIGTPKNAGSGRDVPIDDELRAILRAQWRAQGRPEDGLVFPADYEPPPAYTRVGGGLPLPDQPRPTRRLSTGDKFDNPNALAKRTRPVFDAAGLAGWTPRDLRTLRGSLLIAQGVDVVTVSRRLGHADPTTTLRRYAAVVTERDRAAGAASIVHPERGRRGPRPLPKGEGGAASGI